MKGLYLLCAGMLLAACSFSQNYRPFLPGKLHYFTSGQNYSLRIDSSGEVAGDSVFWMNEISIAPSQTCVTNHSTHFVPHQEGLFADHFIDGGDGSYAFVTRAGDTATFQTLTPIGMPWTFLSDSTLTASISARMVAIVVGQLDSLIIIDISDGRQYLLSQTQGLVDGPNLSYYLRGEPLRTATLAEQPSIPDFKDYFAWQPGDVYNLIEVNGSAWRTYQRFDILARTESPGGDSLTLTIKHRRQRYWIPSPIEPITLDTLTLVYTRQGMRFLELATGEPDTSSAGYHIQNRWVYTSANLPRRSLQCSYYPWPGTVDSCGYGYPMTVPPCNEAMPSNYTVGLGRVSWNTIVGNTMTTCLYETHSLACYEQAGQDTLGPCPAELIILERPGPATDASMQLVGNRQTGEVGIRWEGMPPADYTWQLYDLNGRLLHEENVMMDGNGQRMLPKPGSAGMYLLRIADAQGTWARTLRVPMLAD